MQWRVFLLSIGVLCAQPSNPAGARERLIRADESVFRARALRLKGSEVAEWVTAGHRQTMRTEFSLAAGPDNRMRIERTAGDTTTVQLSDGSNLWTYRTLPGLRHKGRHRQQNEKVNSRQIPGPAPLHWWAAPAFRSSAVWAAIATAFPYSELSKRTMRKPAA